MSKEKQIIEEMAHDICRHYEDEGVCRANLEFDKCDCQCWTGTYLAPKLYDAGYRKQSEGEWTRFEVNSSKGYGQVYYQHKDCETNATQLFPSPYHFCPNCGAKMKGGERHDH